MLEEKNVLCINGTASQPFFKRWWIWSWWSPYLSHTMQKQAV